MTIVRGQFDKFMRPGAKNVYIDDYNELPSVYNQFFEIDTSGKAFEDDLVSTGLGIAVSKPEGEPLAFDRPLFRGRVRYIHSGYGLGYEITREAVEDDQYKALTSKGSTNLARSMRAAEETTAATILNGAFATVSTYDGEYLVSSSHVTSNGTAIPNAPASAQDLSVSALKASLERFWGMMTDRDLKVNIAPTTLLVSHLNWWTAQEILNTQYITGAASGGEISSIISAYGHNVVTQMGLTPVKWNYLTDSKCWFTLAPKGQHSLKFYWRRKPDFLSGTDERAGIAWFGTTARWVAGATDFRGIDGSAGV